MNDDFINTKWRIEYRRYDGTRWQLARWDQGPAIYGSNGEALRVIDKMRNSGDGKNEYRIVKPEGVR